MRFDSPLISKKYANFTKNVIFNPKVTFFIKKVNFKPLKLFHRM